MPRAVKLLIATIGSLLVVLVGGIALLLAVAVADGRAMAFMIEKAATAVLGHDVDVGHAAVADWGMPTTVELTDIAVENAAWADEPSIFRAERIRAALTVSGLFPPAVELPRVAVTAPAVFLAVNAEGKANWQGMVSGSGAPSDGPADLFGLKSFQIAKGNVVYRDAAPGAPRMVRLHGLRAEAPSVDRPITFEAQGQLAAGPSKPQPQNIRFSGGTGSLRQLRKGDLPVRATASVGTVRAEVSGRVTSLFGNPAADLHVVAEGEGLQPLLALAGVAVGSTPSFHAEAQVVKEAARWTADGIQARLGDSRVTGTLTVDASGPKPMVAGEITATTLAVGQLRELAGQGGGQTQGDGPQDLPFGWLHAVNADLTLRAERIEAPSLPLRAGSASVTLKDGILRMDPLRVGMPEGAITGTLRVDATANPPVLALGAKGQGVPVSALPVVAGKVAGMVEGTIAGTADLSSEGRTLGALLANLTGKVRATVDGQVQDQPMHLTLRADTAGSGNAVPVELSGKIGAASVQASGKAALRAAGERVTLHVHSEGPEAGILLALAGVEPPPQTPAYVVDADLRYEGEGARVQAPSLKARLGDMRVEGTASVDLSGKTPMVRADLSVSQLVLESFQRAVPSPDSAGGAGGQLIPPVPLPFDALRSVDAEVSVRVGDVTGTALPVGGAKLDAHLQGGVLRLDPLHLDFADGGIGGTVTANANPSPPTVGASIDLDAISMDAVMSALQVSKRVKGRVNGTVDVRSNGRTLQDVSENLDGTARFFVTEGQFTTRLIDAMAVNIGEALGFLFSEGEMRSVDCVVGRFDIENGVINPETMVFVTPDMVMRGKGRIDLGKETINLTLVPRPKERHLLDVTVPVEAQGPLTDPRIDIGVSFWTDLAKKGVCQRTLSGQGENRGEDQAEQ